MADWWLIIKAVLAILPWIISNIQEGRIREATLDELTELLAKRWLGRVEAASAAGANANTGGVSFDDPNDRAGRSLD